MSIIINGRTVSGLYNAQIFRTATPEAAGVIRLASKAEILAGTSRDAAITPADIKDLVKIGQFGDGFDIDTENGYIDNAIYPLVPTAATLENQLADKAFVTDLVNTYSSRFIGIYESLEALQADTRPAIIPTPEDNTSGENNGDDNGGGSQETTGEETGEETPVNNENTSENGEESGETTSEEPVENSNDSNEGTTGEGTNDGSEEGGGEVAPSEGEDTPSGGKDEEDTRKVVTQNDYALIIFQDELGNLKYDRYSFNGTEWVYEYAFSNLTFTATQWDAINSGINTELVSQIKYPSGVCHFSMDGQSVGSFSADSEYPTYISLMTKTPTWGTIAGNLTDQADLITYLNASLNAATKNLDNLSDSGIELLSSAKCLSTGSIGSSQVVLNYLNNLVTSKPTISDLTTVGEDIEISQEGIATGFNGGEEGEGASYITYTHGMTNPTKVIVNVGFIPALKLTPNTTQCILAFATDNNYDITSRKFSLETNQAGNTLVLYQYDSNGQPYSSLTLASVTAGNKYVCKLVLTSNHVVCYLNGVQVKDVDLRATMEYGSVFQVGLLRYGSKNFAGSIDLKGLYITADKNIVFSGSEMKTATYTLINSTIKFPYRETTLGQKIVESEYRDELQALFNETGYCPYYSLSGADYTLPMGDIYTMIDMKVNKKEASNAAAPSLTYTDETLGASGDSYIAPSDGCYVLKMNTSSESFVELSCTNNGDMDSDRLLGTTSTAYNIVAKLNVFKGEIVIAKYAGGTPSLRFISTSGSI